MEGQNLKPLLKKHPPKTPNRKLLKLKQKQNLKQQKKLRKPQRQRPHPLGAPGLKRRRAPYGAFWPNTVERTLSADCSATAMYGITESRKSR